MNTYLLFVNGLFDNANEIDMFSGEFINLFKQISSPKFVIENQYNMIIIFDSDIAEEEIVHKIKNGFKSNLVRFYFLFNREDIMVANMPQEISALLFKDLPTDSSLEINLINNEEPKKVEDENIVNGEIYIDTLLDKIEKFGIESLTENEKKFLDNFKN